MPTTKKESLYFGLMMCAGMVIVMTFYNMLVNGLTKEMGLAVLCLNLAIGFIAAFLLDFCLVGPLAKKIVFKLPFDKSKKIYIVLAMSTCMVLGMVICMSFFGLVMANMADSENNSFTFANYAATLGKNFIMAYPLQLLVMGPLVRFMFMRFVKPALAANPA
ncbi:DUF2798 domain-containing protein [Paenibacillus sambharensis]|uniref:DUF2798 domain-containing protein n=1 Tax=Paenibacillus sambharensis TaxID=1803190 RepID=A0A2W1LC04_9BACL|nr:DUF2798 domain-containing protein [Paenibacillus sambharensis]PZD96686.1 DUF2798 domain-containing protein [Paenibacillus sambharensis]